MKMRIKKIIYILICISFFSSCKNKESIDLKIMSYNIRHGEGLDTILDLSRSAEIKKSHLNLTKNYLIGFLNKEIITKTKA